MKGSTWRALAVVAVGALVFAGVALAANTKSFGDAGGDASDSPDLTAVSIANDDAGVVTVKLTVGNRSTLSNAEAVAVGLDTDQNPDTGSAFYGTEVELAWSVSTDEPLLFRADGWSFKAGPLPDGGLGWECGTFEGGYFVDPSQLGLTPSSGFNVVAATVSRHVDTAPDIGTFNYQLVAGTQPPKLGPDTRAPHVANVFPARAVHGKLATLTYWTLDGRGKTADTLRLYRGRRLLKTIQRALRDSNPFKLSHVAWRVPRTLRGRLRFSVSSADAAGNESNLRWASLSIR